MGNTIQTSYKAFYSGIKIQKIFSATEKYYNIFNLLNNL